MKKFKKSFIKKMFFSLISLFALIFLFLFIIQGPIFERFYLRKTINNIKNEMSILLDESNALTFNDKLVEFTNNTQTSTQAVLKNEIENDPGNLNVYRLIFEVNNQDYVLYAPNRTNITYHTGDNIVANVYRVGMENAYVPIYLKIENRVIFDINSNDGQFDELFKKIVRRHKYTINTTIKEIIPPSTDLNPVISNELLNISVGIDSNINQYKDGIYYFTNQETSRNLVFISQKNILGQQNYIISVYPLKNIENITSAIRLVNIYIFIAVFIVLALSSFFYSKKLSKPLLSINNSTRRLSQLDFSSELINLESEDEFGELARNINTLSINLKNSLNELKDKNKQLSLSLDRENQSEILKKDFLGAMSHELKTPLAIIQASAEAIVSNVFTTKEEENEQLRIIQNEVKKTSKMIVNLLDLYKLDSTNIKENWTEFKLDDLINNLVINLKPLFSNKGILLETSIGNCSIYADKAKIEIVLNNLITNAIKYTNESEKVMINLFSKKDYVCFEIINTGAMINDEILPRIFEPFYRVDMARSRLEGSSGLGLYIVKQILDQHNTNCIASNTDQGVKFAFKLKTKEII